MTPMRLLRIQETFDHPAFLFEPKIEGFCALAHVDGHGCMLVSRKRPPLQIMAAARPRVRADNVVLDGEICCLDPDGGSNLKALLFRREWPCFYAFDILSLDGRDLTRLPLVERKGILLAVMPPSTVGC